MITTVQDAAAPPWTQPRCPQTVQRGRQETDETTPTDEDELTTRYMGESQTAPSMTQPRQGDMPGLLTKTSKRTNVSL